MGKYRTRKNLLTLTIIEVVSFIICTLCFLSTFRYVLENALNGMMRDFGIAAENVEPSFFIKFCIVSYSISNLVLFISNIIRFLIIDKKCKYLFIFGLFALFLGIFLYYEVLFNTFVQILSLILILVGFLFILFSHKISKDLN